jgi:hypothetical protein
MSGGILMCGVSTGDDTTLYFVMLSSENAEFIFHNIELRYVGQMNSVVYITGGSVCFERVKIDKQPYSYWVNPLIDVDATVSPVTAHFISTNITNCLYRYANTSYTLFKSAVVFFTNTSSNKILTLRISSSSFRNNTLILSGYNTRASVCQFHGVAGSGLHRNLFHLILFYFHSVFVIFYFFVFVCVFLYFYFFKF